MAKTIKDSVKQETAEQTVAPAEEIQSAPDKKETKENVLLGKFLIKLGKDGSYMFNLKASNGEVIATSDMYATLDSCKKGIASIQTNAPIANFEDQTAEGKTAEVVNPKFEMYRDKSGDYRFRLKAKNGSIIAKSQGYASKTNCLNGIESVRKNAATKIIIDECPPKEEKEYIGKFCIKQAKDGSYMFNLKAWNGEIIATSDMYSSLEKCQKGIASVQLNGPIANLEDHAIDGAIEEVVNPKFELYHDKSGDFRFRLKAKNGSIIAKSQGYSNKTACKNGIESVRKNAMTNEIVTEE